MSASKPTDVAATADGSVPSITVTWTLHGPYTVLGLRRSKDGGAYTSLGSVIGLSEKEDTTISVDHSYTYKLYWEDEEGFGYSDESNSCGVYTTTISDTCTGTASCTDTRTRGTTITDTCTGTDSYISSATVSSTIAETCTGTEAIQDTQTIKTDYSYYIGGANGSVFAWADDKYSDAGSVITSTWRSKYVDFVDQDPTNIDRWKTILGIKLHYKDYNAHTVSVSVSADGGASWDTDTRIFGTASTAAKTETFFFNITGQRFLIQLSHGSTDKLFTWYSLEVEYIDAGEHIQI